VFNTVGNTVNSTAVFDHVIFRNSQRPVYFAFGTLIISNSQFTANTGEVLTIGTQVQTAKLSISNSTFQQNAGPVFLTVDSDVTINSVNVVGRSDASDRGSQFNGGKVEIRNSHFSNLWSGSQCGGALQSTGSTTIAGSTFAGNRSTCGGGAVFISGEAPGVHLSNLTFDNNQSKGRGGAISIEELALGAPLDFKFGAFHNNSADFGGALAISGSGTRRPLFQGTALSFKNNSSTQNGAAVYVDGAKFQLTRGIFLENKPGTGGSLAISGEPFVLANLLVARNAGPAGIQADAGGELISSTIADNQGIGLTSSGRLRVINTVVANNRKQNCQFTGSETSLENAGSNVQFPGPGCSQTIAVANPMLDNFYVPDLNSPLRNAGVNEVCVSTPDFARDVYGQRRPRAVNCTIGAVEGDIAQLIHHLDDVGPSFSVPGSGPGTGGVAGKPASLKTKLSYFFLPLLALSIVWFILRFRKRRHHHH